MSRFRPSKAMEMGSAEGHCSAATRSWARGTRSAPVTSGKILLHSTLPPVGALRAFPAIVASSARRDGVQEQQGRRLIIILLFTERTRTCFHRRSLTRTECLPGCVLPEKRVSRCCCRLPNSLLLLFVAAAASPPLRSWPPPPPRLGSGHWSTKDSPLADDNSPLV